MNIKKIGFSHQQFLIFKWTVYSLLALNVFFYFMAGKPLESLDSFSWVVIIALYEWETTSFDEEYSHRFEQYAITFFRLLAYVIIVYCDVGYFQEGKWLDFANASTWLLVCVTLEYDVYYPGNFESAEWKIRNYIKLSLYGLLFIYCIIWLIKAEALDFYDAFLWFMAFVVIELNIFGNEQKTFDNAQEIKV